jgi:amidase
MSPSREARGRRNRRLVSWLGWSAACLSLAACMPGARPVEEGDGITAMSAVELQAAIAAGRLSAEAVTAAFLDRIAAIDDAGPELNAIIETNPDALATARALDADFADAGVVGPLHGIPVVVKANIDTGDRMATSAGSLALADHHARDDAILVARLREAGAVIIAKANLSEWANFRSNYSSSGWSSLGGQTKNPYVLDRNPCGSSSGSAVAVAARLAPLAVGTETNGSIVCPSGANGVVGIKPTLGLVEQDGIIPIAASQDTAGPMARTVTDAALLLSAMSATGAGYTIDSVNLRGVRLGVVRAYTGAGRYPRVDALFESALETLRGLGAELVDPVEISYPEGFGDAELELLLYEFRDGIDDYLAGSGAPFGSLAQLIAFNEGNADRVMPIFGQDLFTEAMTRGDLTDRAYHDARDNSVEAMRRVLRDLFEAHSIQALVAPVNGPAWATDWVNGDAYGIGSSGIAAVSGYPSVAVPAGLVSELPVAIAFIGRPMTEESLLGMAAAFERARGSLPGPRFLISLEN